MAAFLRLLKLIGPFRWWIVLGVLLSAATSAASVGLLAVSAYLISKAALSTTVVDLALLITGVRFFAISRAALRYAERYINHKATFRILTRLRVWFYRAVEPLAPAGLEAHHSGDLLARIAADIETLENFYLRVLIPPLAAALVTAVAATILGSFDLRLALALLVFVLLTGIALPLASRYLSRHAAQDVISLRADLNVALLDGVQGMADLLAYGHEAAHGARAAALTAALHGRQERLALVRGLSNGLGVLFTGLAALTVLGLAAPLVYGGRIEGIFLALLPLTAIAAFEAIQPLSQSLQWLAVSQSAAQRVFALIDAPPAVYEPSAPIAMGPDLHPALANNSGPACQLTGPYSGTAPAPCIVFADVRFRYAAGEPWVLDGFSLRIPAGSTCGIAGPNGSGKSTLAKLLLRFWDYSAGSIRIGGVELRDLPSGSARALFSVVPQHTHLFNATIRANLHVANPDATDAELAAACRQAELHDWIAGLPDGYDTMIGENGFRLSGGERQRLAIARAVLKAAPVLILDEATAQLDLLTESALLASLRPFMAGRTVIIISHRHAPLQGLDQVVTLMGPERSAPALPIPR
jgi:thiol reductant ABC exporter CydC subunit